jgi:hypothetical protein
MPHIRELPDRSVHMDDPVVGGRSIVNTSDEYTIHGAVSAAGKTSGVSLLLSFGRRSCGMGTPHRVCAINC